MQTDKLPRGTIKRFREYLNAQDNSGYKHRHFRFQQRTRKYGDYLYAQDREKFMVDLQEWLTTNPPTGTKGER
jgi:hypothetical protein